MNEGLDHYNSRSLLRGTLQYNHKFSREDLKIMSAGLVQISRKSFPIEDLFPLYDIHSTNTNNYIKSAKLKDKKFFKHLAYSAYTSRKRLRAICFHPAKNIAK